MFIILLLFVFICFFVAGNIAYLLLNDNDNPDTDPTRKKQKIFLVALWFPLMASWFVFTYTAYNNSQSDLHSAELKFKLQQLQWLESANNSALNIADSINASLFEITTFKETERLLCVNGEYTGNKEEFLINQYQRLLKLEQIAFSARVYFGDGVYELVRDYLSQKEQSAFSCENTAADAAFLTLQNDINYLIDERMEKKLDKVISLKNDIE